MVQTELEKNFLNFLGTATIEQISSIIDIKGLHYSFFNHLFMTYQKPKIEHIVKPFSEWKKENTYILAGEKSLRVFTPTFFKKEVEKDGQKEVVQILKGFLLCPVFDISQTTKYAEYKQTITEAENLCKNKAFIDYNIVKDLIKIDCCEIVEKEGTGTNCFIPNLHKIEIYEKNSQILLHEYGHFLSYNFIKLNALGYEWGEITAELFSYLVLKLLGQTEFNYTYSKIWASRIPNKDIKVFEKILKFLENEIKRKYPQILGAENGI